VQWPTTQRPATRNIGNCDLDLGSWKVKTAPESTLFSENLLLGDHRHPVLALDAGVGVLKNFRRLRMVLQYSQFSDICKNNQVPITDAAKETLLEPGKT